MIDPHCLTLDWLKEKRKVYKKSDPSIMERVVFALLLLQKLQTSGLQFVFKGGTSLLLLLPEPARFSVDIDIIVSPALTREELERFINAIPGVEFLEVILDEKRSYKESIPKAHYRFLYRSPYAEKPQEILLDILFEEINYPVCIDRPITSEWIRLTADPVMVRTPDLNGIAGDKLAAFAPSTTGVPYGKEKEKEIIKQLFDVGMLYHLINDLASFKEAYRRIATLEIRYRYLPVTMYDVLDDTINTALILARRDSQVTGTDKAKWMELFTGIKQFSYFVYNGNFRIEDAILAGSKAAFLAATIKMEYNGSLPEFDPNSDPTSYQITHLDFFFLNKKLKHVRGALFYWFETVKLLHPSPQVVA